MSNAAENVIRDTPHPGEFIREEMEARGLGNRDLAYILDVPEQAVSMIVSGKRGISPDMAKALGVAFDVHADLFANLQRAYEMSRAKEPDPGVAQRARLSSAYPVREMIRRGWLEESDADTLEKQMASFFCVASINDVPHLAHAAKKTDYEDTPAEQLAWLFRVRQIARGMAVPAYSESKLRDALPRLHALMSAPEEARNVARILMECGVRFVIVEALPKARIDGVCFWLDDKSPVIGMSLFYDRIDNFWFVVRHEIEHVLRRDGQEKPIIDAELEGDRAGDGPGLPEEERIANAAASDFCVPTSQIASFVARKSPFFSERDVLAFARRMGVHAGLVIGQIQRRTKRWDLLRKHLVKIRHHVVPGAIADGWGQVAPVIAKG